MKPAQKYLISCSKISQVLWAPIGVRIFDIPGAGIVLIHLTADGTCISNPCWNFVEGGDATQAIIFDLFPDTGRHAELACIRVRPHLRNTALNLTFRDINVRPFEKPENATTVICDPTTLVPGEQDTLGFKCTSGPLETTEIKSTGNGAISATPSPTLWSCIALLILLAHY